MPSAEELIASALSDKRERNVLELSNAYRISGYMTTNDKILLEMYAIAAERRKAEKQAIEPEATPVNSNYEKISTRSASSQGQHKLNIGKSAAAENATEKRYTFIHSRRSAKMDSITLNNAAKNHPKQLTSDQNSNSNDSKQFRNYSNTRTDYLTSKVASNRSSITISPSKRETNNPFSIVPTRLRVDQYGNMIKDETPAAGFSGVKASSRVTSHLDNTTGSIVDNKPQQRYSRNGVERSNLASVQSTPSKLRFSGSHVPSRSADTSSSSGSGMSRSEFVRKYSRSYPYNDHDNTPSNHLASSRRHSSSSSSSSSSRTYSLSSSYAVGTRQLSPSTSSSRISSSSSPRTVGKRQLSPSTSSSRLSGRYSDVDSKIPRLVSDTRRLSLNSANTLSSDRKMKAENTELGHPVSTSSFGTEHYQQQNQKGLGLLRTGSLAGKLSTLQSMIPRSTALHAFGYDPSYGGRF